jgi:putative DNA methylase
VRMIERWFPCAEVSEASQVGWGSGNAESSLWVWFAKRPLVQAKAAVLTSLLPWPEDADDQRRLQDLVRRALTGRGAADAEVARELARHYPKPAAVVDPFSGRAMIPLEAARLGLDARGIDYSPFASLGGSLLARGFHAGSRDTGSESAKVPAL